MTGIRDIHHCVFGDEDQREQNGTHQENRPPGWCGCHEVERNTQQEGGQGWQQPELSCVTPTDRFPLEYRVIRDQPDTSAGSHHGYNDSHQVSEN